MGDAPIFCLWRGNRGRRHYTAMMSSEERNLFDLLRPSVEALGYEFVGVELERTDARSVVRLFIDQDGGIAHEDCERVSHQVAAELDVEDPIPESYDLEVSSPGLDRRLLTPDHFTRFAGHPVRLHTVEPVHGRRGWTAQLIGCREQNVVLRDGGGEWSIPFALVEKANLVPEV